MGVGPLEGDDADGGIGGSESGRGVDGAEDEMVSVISVNVPRLVRGDTLERMNDVSYEASGPSRSWIDWVIGVG